MATLINSNKTNVAFPIIGVLLDLIPPPQISIHVDTRVALQWIEVGDPWYISQELALDLRASSIQPTISHSLFP